MLGTNVPSDDVMSTPSNSSNAAVLYSERASPQESKPEPIFALVAGTLTFTIPRPYSAIHLSVLPTRTPAARAWRTAPQDARLSRRAA